SQLAPRPWGRARSRAPGAGNAGRHHGSLAPRRPSHPRWGDPTTHRRPRHRGVVRPPLRLGLPGAGAGRAAALALADYRLEPAAGRATARPDGRARRADRPGLRGPGPARPPGGSVVRRLDRRRAAAAPDGGRATHASGPRAADAAVRAAHLPARIGCRPGRVLAVTFLVLPGA